MIFGERNWFDTGCSLIITLSVTQAVLERYMSLGKL